MRRLKFATFDLNQPLDTATQAGSKPAGTHGSEQRDQSVLQIGQRDGCIELPEEHVGEREMITRADISQRADEKFNQKRLGLVPKRRHVNAETRDA